MNNESGRRREGDRYLLSRTRPWILTLDYWNSVAQDVVKASVVAFTLYLAGSLGGIFTLQTQVLWVATIAFAYFAFIALLQWVISRWEEIPTTLIGLGVLVQWLLLPVVAIALHRLVHPSVADPRAWVVVAAIILLIYGVSLLIAWFIWRVQPRRRAEANRIEHE